MDGVWKGGERNGTESEVEVVGLEVVVRLMLAELSVVLVNSFAPPIIPLRAESGAVGGGVIAGCEEKRVANRRH